MVIAKAGLALVDHRGLDALTLRNLASELGVGTTTVYRHVSSKDEIALDVVALLFAEMSLDPQPGDGLGDWIRRAAFSMRAMALRHPRAFPLYATAPVDKAPVLDYARRFLRALGAYGVAEKQAVAALQVFGGYLTGFLLQEAAEKVRLLDAPTASAHEEDPLRDQMALLHRGDTFAMGLDAVYEGLRHLQVLRI